MSFVKGDEPATLNLSLVATTGSAGSVVPPPTPRIITPSHFKSRVPFPRFPVTQLIGTFQSRGHRDKAPTVTVSSACLALSEYSLA